MTTTEVDWSDDTWRALGIVARDALMGQHNYWLREHLVRIIETAAKAQVAKVAQ